MPLWQDKQSLKLAALLIIGSNKKAKKNKTRIKRIKKV